MAVTISILYPAAADLQFNMDYYKNSHMPMVQRKWSKYGLQSWSVSQSSDPTSGPYHVHTFMIFDSAEGFQRAAAEDSEEVMADIKNYCNKKPDQFIGEVVAKNE